MLVKGLLLFFAFVLFFRSDQSFNQDLGRHLKTGEIILQNFSVPKINLFSFTNPDFPFINTHWLFGVVLLLLSQTIGIQLLLVFKIAIFLLTIWFTLKLIPKDKNIWLLPIGFIFFHVLRERTDLRPEIFSFLFTATTYYVLEKFLTNKTRLIFLLPLIQLLWINTHIYFFVGIVLQFIFLIYLSYQRLRFKIETQKLKLLSVIFITSIVLSLINPNGFYGLFYPLKVTGNYGYSIVENQNIFLLESINFSNSNFIFTKVSVGIIVFMLLLSLIRRKFDLRSSLIASFGLSLAIMHVRSLPYLVFLSLPAVMQNFGVVKKNVLSSSLLVITSLLLLTESFFYLNGEYYENRNSNVQSKLIFEENGKNAMDFVLKNNLSGPIFNNFDIGSYIIYRSYPKIKVFVDGRPEAYPADFFQSTYIPIQSDFAKFKEAEKIFHFETIVFSYTDQTPWAQNFLQNIIKDSSWKIVFIDDYMIIFTKSDSVDNLASIDLANLTPSQYSFSYYLSYLRIGIFLNNTGYQEAATRFIEKVSDLSPNNPLLTGKKSRFFW